MRDALFSFVVNAAWQAALTGGLGMLVARLLRSPRQRFELLALALVVSVVAPALTLIPRGASGGATELPAVQTHVADAVAWLYALGFAIAAVRLLVAALHARRLAVGSIPFRGRIRLSPMVDGPVTIGRTVLVPPFVIGDRRLLAAAAAHEHAHVRRNDSLLQIGLEVLALPLYFHPMVYRVRRAISDAREMACDEEAAARRGRREYAEALVQLASLAAQRRTALAIGMAEASVERRVRALLTSNAAPGARRAAPLVVLFAAAAACSRVDVAPAVQQAPLGGRWTLIAEASDLRAVRAAGYERFTQTIDQKPDRVSVHQQRTAGGRMQEVTWSVITDGVTRPVDGMPGKRGSALWRNGKLELQLAGPGAHRENAAAFLRGGRLVCEGKTERAAYHAEFRRVTP